MRIAKPEVTIKHGRACLSARIEHAEGEMELWYSVHPKYAELLTTETLDAFLLGALLLAMKNGEDIHLHGPVSEKLYYSVTQYYMSILTSQMPWLSEVGICPDGFGTCPSVESGVVTGFSGGIDSFCALADHYYADVPPAHKVTHLIFNNVGSHGKGHEARKLFLDRYERIRRFAEESGLPLIRVDSNLDDLLNMGYQQTNTIRNVSAVLTLQKLFGKYLFASSYCYEDCFVGETYDMSYADPFALHLLSTESTECIATGSQYTRVEKTRRVTGLPPSYRYLDVCISPEGGGNCSRCRKCAKVLLTLEILGKERLYDQVFDLEGYRQKRVLLIAKLLADHRPLSREVVRFAAASGYPLPPLSRILASHPVRRALRLVPGSLRRKAKELIGFSQGSPIRRALG